MSGQSPHLPKALHDPRKRTVAIRGRTTLAAPEPALLVIGSNAS